MRYDDKACDYYEPALAMSLRRYHEGDYQMPVQVRYFAALREATGRDIETLQLPAGTTVDQIRSLLVERYPALSTLLPRCAVAVNRSYAGGEATLDDGDELAFIPPLGGG
jgi:molybdopterin converting factor subunit 1